MSRREFSKAVRRDALNRCNGYCDGCRAPLTFGKYQFDHIVADSMGGRPELDNCQVLCSACHGAKTAKLDTPRAAKTERMRAKFLGIYPRGQKIQSRPFQKRALAP